MIKKVILIVAALFLTALFLSTIGSFYTGYSVLNQKEITLKNYPYPFIKNFVPNDVYVVLPYDSRYEEYNAAINIARSLKGTNPLLQAPQIVTINEIPEGVHNLILIGNPCNNQLIAKELSTDECNLGLQKGQGYLKLINHEKSSTLIISGYSIKDIPNAVSVIVNNNYYPLRGNEIEVSGTKNLVLNYH